jgi:hypothetical protein
VTLFLIALAVWFAVSICAGMLIGLSIHEMGRNK